jgi:hypothetical protein
VQVQPLPCLLPPRLASVLPDLEELDVRCWPGEEAATNPIPYCASLRKARYEIGGGESLIPSKYHTSEDLRRQLPNVASLKISVQCYSAANNINVHDCIDTMLQAWGGGLTKLKLGTDITPFSLQHCTRLQSLTWYDKENVPRLAPLAPSLTKLKLGCEIKESDLTTVLQLSVLHKLEVTGFRSGLQQDWSEHRCSWKQLKISSLRMVDLSKLPLHSLRGTGCLNITVSASGIVLMRS